MFALSIGLISCNLTALHFTIGFIRHELSLSKASATANFDKSPMMNQCNSALFESYAARLVGLTVNHIWRGHGSAIFLEAGNLSPSMNLRRSGTPLEPQGELSVMIQWSWRVEGRRSILCGSWDDDELWQRGNRFILGAAITRAALFGNLQEITLDFSSGVRLASFMTSEGQPAWTIFDQSQKNRSWIFSRHGKIVAEHSKWKSALP